MYYLDKNYYLYEKVNYDLLLRSRMSRFTREKDGSYKIEETVEIFSSND